jgi:preprotein translocase subunit SecE
VSEQRGSTSTPERGHPSDPSNPGFFGRIARFFRQVAAEMRKVVWPTRSQLITYTAVVIVFVSLFSVLVLGFDLGMAKLVSAVFGG